MIHRATSIEAYRQIEAEGLLSEMRFRVYSALYHVNHRTGESCTAQELASTFPASDRNSSVGLNLHARLGELRARKVVAECGERKCRVTGRNAILWHVTDCLPVEPDEPDRLTRQELEEEIRRLRDALCPQCLDRYRRMCVGGQ